ncbi:MAG: RNA 2',3'-cyclic phosphodiesterase [Nitrospirae bacterium]|nr:RNA 2',3'-cyclic phosphodiesterase [Nitrospirota bacterium]
MYLRCFVSIEIPETVKQVIGYLVEILKKRDVDVRWVENKNIHLTLKFLGKTPEKLLPRINESLQKVAISYDPIYIKICKTGVFPNRKYPRVIWVGIEDSETLIRLQSDIENSITLLGFQKEERTFHPHLTIARVRSQRGIQTLINELDNHREKDFGGVEVRSIKLMRSELKPTGAQYYCIYEIPLGRRKDDK